MRYTLKDIKALSNENPRMYPVLKTEYLEKVKPGCIVKLIIERNHDKIFYKVLKSDDRILVRVIGCENDKITGVIIFGAEEKIVGKHIEFGYNNILFVYENESKVVDFNKYVAISNKALKFNQINWVFKSTPLDCNDSGWQLFYGDEDNEYIRDSSNIKMITMAEALKKEPLLEYVIIEKIENAEYSSRVNKFLLI